MKSAFIIAFICFSVFSSFLEKLDASEICSDTGTNISQSHNEECGDCLKANDTDNHKDHKKSCHDSNCFGSAHFGHGHYFSPEFTSFSHGPLTYSNELIFLYSNNLIPLVHLDGPFRPPLFS